MTDVTIATLDGQQMPAYRADPAGAPRGAIVVIQEIFGVNAGIRRKCDTLAAAGYLAIAPDLFWRMEPGIELDPDVDAEMQRALAIMGDFDQDAGIRDIEATIRYARAESGAKVGAVGYCLGGRLAYMTAARTDVDASVGYYAVGVDGLLGEKHAIANPLMLHIAGDDGFVGQAMGVLEIHEARHQPRIDRGPSLVGGEEASPLPLEPAPVDQRRQPNQLVPSIDHVDQPRPQQIGLFQ